MSKQAQKKFKAKKFRVLLEGATTDGREVQRQWIEQMAKNYDANQYGARINLEHIKGLLPEGPFKSYGDVLSLSAEEVDVKGTKKLALFAELSPTEDLITLNKQRQKVYTSCEVDPSFSDTGEAYLTGIAITDSPASLGTEMLMFSSKAEHNPLAERKTNQNCLFTEAVEQALEFEEDAGDAPLLAKVKAMFTKHSQQTGEASQAFKADIEQTMGLFVEELTSATANAEKLSSDHEALKTAHEKLQADFTALKETLDNEPNTQHHSRQAATGEEQDIATDC